MTEHYNYSSQASASAGLALLDDVSALPVALKHKGLHKLVGLLLRKVPRGGPGSGSGQLDKLSWSPEPLRLLDSRSAKTRKDA